MWGNNSQLVDKYLGEVNSKLLKSGAQIEDIYKLYAHTNKLYIHAKKMCAHNNWLGTHTNLCEICIYAELTPYTVAVTMHHFRVC